MKTDREDRDTSVMGWRCDGCKRSETDGAVPAFSRTKAGKKARRAGSIHALLCERCEGRIRRTRVGRYAPPLDMPTSASGTVGAERTKRMRALRAYWEARIFDAAMSVAECDTDYVSEPTFHKACRQFFATVTESAQYLRRGDYVDRVVPPMRVQ